MAKTMLTYTTVNNLGERILQMQKDYILKTSGDTILIGEILKEIGKHCGVSADAIDKVKMHINQPSLPLALKICEYFKCRPDDIFTLVPIRCTHCGSAWDGVDRETPKRLVCGKCKQVFEPNMN